MPKEKKPPALREQAFACLARREHSHAELARKLEVAGHPAEEIAALLDEFETRNWLSDQRFAESYVADHQAKYGSIKLAYELRQRGVPNSIIEAVLSDVCDSELARAKKVWQKKFGSLPKNTTDKARQLRFMQSRGFKPSLINQIIASTD